MHYWLSERKEMPAPFASKAVFILSFPGKQRVVAPSYPENSHFPDDHLAVALNFTGAC